MEVLDIKGNDLNPNVYLNHLEHKFSITGESRPENPIKFYEPVFKWFENYFNHLYVLNDLSNTTNSNITKRLIINLEYFNSTSAKVLFDLFSFLKITGIEKFKITFEIDWFYHVEDTDMLEAGKEMENMCGLKFNYHPKL
ncbi:MAG: DUF1987 domain-containing protein [Bacteroidetes bacterium]|nr:DUF1987 domain-containing protein [Bacteroidota bacterium]